MPPKSHKSFRAEKRDSSLGFLIGRQERCCFNRPFPGFLLCTVLISKLLGIDQIKSSIHPGLLCTKPWGGTFIRRELNKTAGNTQNDRPFGRCCKKIPPNNAERRLSTLYKTERGIHNSKIGLKYNVADFLRGGSPTNWILIIHP